MWNLVKEILTSPFGSFAFVMSILSLMFFLAFKAGGVLEKFKVVNKLEKSIDKIKDDMTFVKTSISLFEKIFQRDNNPFAQSQSPIDLNDKGKEASGEIGAKMAINNVWGFIKSQVDELLKKESDKNPYTIQEACFEIGKSFATYFVPSDLEKIKTYAFKEGVNLGFFDLLIGLEIRNRYFKENDIPVSDVDQPESTKR